MNDKVSNMKILVKVFLRQGTKIIRNVKPEVYKSIKDRS